MEFYQEYCTDWNLVWATCRILWQSMWVPKC